MKCFHYNNIFYACDPACNLLTVGLVNCKQFKSFKNNVYLGGCIEILDKKREVTPCRNSEPNLVRNLEIGFIVIG